jgi:RNA polymerase sigma factor (TIGR02999 family)
LVYDELRRLAAHRIRQERAGLTLQATSLVHEAFVRLVEGNESFQWQNRRHFFAAAAEAMRRILIERARRHQSLKRGGGLGRVSLDDMTDPDFDVENADELLAVNEALIVLEDQEPRKAQLVKLRYFAGMTLEEAAEALDISLATAKRDWTSARVWLYRRLEEGEN